MILKLVCAIFLKLDIFIIPLLLKNIKVGRGKLDRRFEKFSEKKEIDEMLELRPVCECCARELPPDSTEALICSFECTFCADCARNALGGVCPNCGGDLTPRPTRAARLLIKNPAAVDRIVKEHGCRRAAPAGCAVGGQ